MAVALVLGLSFNEGGTKHKYPTVLFDPIVTINFAQVRFIALSFHNSCRTS